MYRLPTSRGESVFRVRYLPFAEKPDTIRRLGLTSDPAHNCFISVAGLSIEANLRLRRIRVHGIDQRFKQQKAAGDDSNASSDQNAIISLYPQFVREHLFRRFPEVGQTGIHFVVEVAQSLT